MTKKKRLLQLRTDKVIWRDCNSLSTPQTSLHWQVFISAKCMLWSQEAAQITSSKKKLTWWCWICQCYYRCLYKARPKVVPQLFCMYKERRAGTLVGIHQILKQNVIPMMLNSTKLPKIVKWIHLTGVLLTLAFLLLNHQKLAVRIWEHKKLCQKEVVSVWECSSRQNGQVALCRSWSVDAKQRATDMQQLYRHG